MTTVEHCGTLTPHTPHRTDRGDFGIQECPGILAHRAAAVPDVPEPVKMTWLDTGATGQKIRARALAAAVGLHLGAATGDDHPADANSLVAAVLDTAATFEAYIRDGDAGIVEAELPDPGTPL